MSISLNYVKVEDNGVIQKVFSQQRENASRRASVTPHHLFCLNLTQLLLLSFTYFEYCPLLTIQRNILIKASHPTTQTIASVSSPTLYIHHDKHFQTRLIDQKNKQALLFYFP